MHKLFELHEIKANFILLCLTPLVRWGYFDHSNTSHKTTSPSLVLLILASVPLIKTYIMIDVASEPILTHMLMCWCTSNPKCEVDAVLAHQPACSRACLDCTVRDKRHFEDHLLQFPPHIIPGRWPSTFANLQ